MRSFLQQIIEYSGVLQASASGGSDMLFVFPNRRACLHFKHELASQLNRPLWSPGTINLADLVRQQYPGQIADPLTPTFELFRVYRNTVEGGANETLDSFYPWGNMMLRDFNEADRYLFRAGQLFREIRDLRELEVRF